MRFSQTQTDDAAAFTDHQCHLRCSKRFYCVDNIAFVFAIFIIEQQHTTPLT
ncbi:Uncharacterised protein [Vibrio cholerae]|nr:Uncharacterised protein [Vibrio cholerae]